MSMPEASSPATKSLECPTPASLLRRYGLRAQKNLGQNFLQSPALAAEIVRRAAVPPKTTVVELGVGLGTLTYALAKTFERVIGFEIDEKLLAILQKEDFLPKNVELRRGDILRLDYRALAQELGAPLILFGNLPYYLSSRLLFRLLEEREALSLAVFMFQKEVAERLTAAPGSKTYGPLSVLLCLLAEVKWLLTLSPAQFYPRPEVASAVLKIRFHREPVPAEGILFQLVKTAFAKRRKTLARNLTALGLSLGEGKDLLRSLGFPEDLRAEGLPPGGFLRLAEILHQDFR